MSLILIKYGKIEDHHRLDIVDQSEYGKILLNSKYTGEPKNLRTNKGFGSSVGHNRVIEIY